VRRQLFYSLAVIVAVTGPLLLGAMLIEVIYPKSRRWIRSLSRLERGRRAQRQEQA